MTFLVLARGCFFDLVVPHEGRAPLSTSARLTRLFGPTDSKLEAIDKEKEEWGEMWKMKVSEQKNKMRINALAMGYKCRIDLPSHPGVKYRCN